MKNVSQHSFAQVPAVQLPRSVFNRNRAYKTTLNAGFLTPVYIDDVLPGDTFNVNIQSFMRLMTPIVPFMENLWCDFFFFFVPNRLVWDNWQKFCGERDSPVSDYNNDTAYLVPQITPDNNAGFQPFSLADYFGIPTGVPGLSVDALPFRGYYLIWNEFFRDENLQSSINIYTGDETRTDAGHNLIRTAQRPTYFNKSLPWPMKGPSVELPLGDQAPVYGTTALGIERKTASSGTDDLTYGTSSKQVFFDISDNLLGVSSDGSKSGLVSDLSHATAATINSIREAFQIQLFYEQSARGGTRYIEILRSMFGVVSPDARLQRPEYLGGGHVPIQIHAVTQTSSTDATSPQGNLAAYGVASGRAGFTKSFVEHGWVFGFARVRLDSPTYQQGLDRMWSRRTKFDYYWPPFAHLGEQAVLNKEIYAQGPSVKDGAQNVIDELPFGYQERYAEYRYGVSHVTGALRSTYAQSLDVWHLGYKYDSLPVLGDAFISENPPLARVIAVQNNQQFLYDSVITCNCVRTMPTYSVPGRVDHF